MEDFSGRGALKPPPTVRALAASEHGPPANQGRKCQWMKPKALESKLDEGWERGAKHNQMLNICRNERGWDLIVRTPKLI